MRHGNQAIGGKIRAFGADRRGNFAVLTAAVASMLALAVGFAVDIAQLYNIKSSLRNALDAAITSTARDITTGKIKPEDARATFEAFMLANADPQLAGADKVKLDQFVVDKTSKTVSATAYVDAGLFFPLFRSGSSQRVGSQSAALYSDKKVEVAMMLDVTGSMSGQKIEDLKDAATDAVDALLGNQDEDEPRVRVAIVPYAEAVNTGKLSDTVFVEKEHESDVPQSTAVLPMQISASTADLCATERKNADGTADFSADGPDTQREDEAGNWYFARVNLDDRISKVRNSDKPKCPDAAIIPLTADKQKLLNTIDDFKADGNTSGGIAVQWGYYMLSPNWRNAISDSRQGAGPANYNAKKVSKVAILMTDGQFNTAFAGVPVSDAWEDQPQQRQGEKSRAYAEALCENMRHDGIEIFTIGFALDEQDRDASEESKAVLQACATDDTSVIKHYYEASTGEDLKEAFRSIIANIERLTITR